MATLRATTDSTLPLLQVVKAMEADPHVNRKNLPVRTGRAFLDGFNAVASKSSTVGLPLLIMHSPIDKVCQLLSRLSAAQRRHAQACSACWSTWCLLSE